MRLLQQKMHGQILAYKMQQKIHEQILASMAAVDYLSCCAAIHSHREANDALLSRSCLFMPICWLSRSRPKQLRRQCQDCLAHSDNTWHNVEQLLPATMGLDGVDDTRAWPECTAVPNSGCHPCCLLDCSLMFTPVL